MCYGYKSATLTNTGTWGNVYELLPVLQAAFPFKFVAAPIEIGAYAGNGMGVFTECNNDNNDSALLTTSAKYLALRPNGASVVPAGRKVWVNIIVEGRWK